MTSKSEMSKLASILTTVFPEQWLKNGMKRLNPRNIKDGPLSEPIDWSYKIRKRFKTTSREHVQQKRQ